MQAAEPIDVERNKLRQQILTLSSKRVDLLRGYIVSCQFRSFNVIGCSILTCAASQKIMHEAIDAQNQASRAGLEYLQVAANKAALEGMCKEQKEEIEKAKKAFGESKLTLYQEMSVVELTSIMI